MRSRLPTSSCAALATALLAVSCNDSGSSDPDGGLWSGFADHTSAALESVASFEALASTSGRLTTVKFTITRFGDDATRAVVFYDGAFYRLHDEWYWFRLLNGERVPGDEEVEPVEGLSLPTLREIYAWARAQQQLPLDLQFTSKRLYSPRFYKGGLSVYPKRFGLGSLLRIADADGGPERWAFQLEYTDAVSHAELTTFFETLEAKLPEVISAKLHWLVRSPPQEVLAKQMTQQSLRYADRILRYSDISKPGEIEVYNPGLTAGRVLIVNDGGDLARANDQSILVLPDIPDELPAATAVISAVPQTPLAHINLLAQNRGIPNLYLGDALMHPELQKLDASYGWAILRAEAPDRMSLAPMTHAEYAHYKQLRTLVPVRLPALDPEALPYVIDLSGVDLGGVDLGGAGGLAAMDALRPQIGGKATGFLALLAEPTVDVPDTPLALTVRAYLEHVASLRPLMMEMLGARAFAEDARIRFLVLEGREAFDQSYREPSDQAAADSFVSARPTGDALGDLVRAGGLKRKLRDKPIAPATLATLTAAVTKQFAELSPEQGLRFRSSSTVEDIEGFNGAGLYDSNTGFIDPSARADKGERAKTLSWAIKKTWASYWSHAAYEERRRERVDHLSGAMAVLVHPRFEDPLELANGVFTLTVRPPSQGSKGTGALAVMELNVQKGALSVTNPPGANERPEVDRVTLAASGETPEITRVSSSTVAQPGERLLSDAQLRALFAQARAVTQAWLAQRNQGVPDVQHARSLTLDFEFRYMDHGWPARVDGATAGKRLVIKQARPLEPGLRRVKPTVRMLPVPRELLARARRVQHRRCIAQSATAQRVTFSFYEVLTDPATKPDLGHTETPFVAWLRLEVFTEQPALGWLADVYHLAFDEVSHGGAGCGAGSCPISVKIAEHAGLMAPTSVELRADGSYHIARGAERFSGTVSGCEVRLLHSTPTDYLLSLLARHEASAAEAN